MTSTQHTQDWKERFDEKISNLAIAYLDAIHSRPNSYVEQIKELKSFTATEKQRSYQEGQKEADKLTKAIHVYNTDGIKALKEAECKGYQAGVREVQKGILNQDECILLGIQKAFILKTIDTLLKEGKEV